MSDILLDLVSEEIPARMQIGASRDLARLLEDALVEANVWTKNSNVKTFCGPRHLVAYVTNVLTKQADRIIEKRGPRVGAPESAVLGFLNSAGVKRADLIEENTSKGTFFFARNPIVGNNTATILPKIVNKILRGFPWPNSQRWGEGKQRWVRPLHRINLLFDGKLVEGEFEYGEGQFIPFGAKSCGHYFEAPWDVNLLGVDSLDTFKRLLKKAYVVIDTDERETIITEEANKLAKKKSCRISTRHSTGYLNEVSGLVEWPCALIGEIDHQFMMLPPEVLQVAIATHQKYITLEYDSGEFSPFFVVVSNRLSDKARDKRIIKGNQRVLRARLSDAEFFWKQDTSRPLESYINALRDVTFYQGLGSIYDKTKRLQSLVEKITPYVVGADVQVTLRTAKLSKADLVTSMVREFPELQGVVGGYYARASGEKDQVSEAISEHYRPQGAKDELPSSPEAIIVSLADKLDTLTGFFCIGVKPTGSKDPFALRRAALGVIRIIIDCGLKIPLKKVLDAAVNGYDFEILDPDLMPFIRQRLFVHLRDQKMRHDIVAASLASSDGDDISIITNRARALATFIDSNDGLALVGVWRRVSNILVAEEKRTNEVFGSDPDPELFNDIERELFDKLSLVPLREDDIQLQLRALVELQTPTDSFFNNLIVNHEDTKIRKNRLGLLAKIRNTMLSIADFRKIEG